MDNITGNCWNNRHHTCQGKGRMKNKGFKRMEEYKCACKCHNTKEND